jgi:hypothetical protein
MNKILKEGLDHMDMQGQIIPKINIDKYVAKMGGDDEIITVGFTIKGAQASEDLTDWFERGYDWLLDAKVSDGEITNGKYVVFVEMDRRTTAPERIIELIEDLETLTGLTLEDWTMTIGDQDYPADAGKIKELVTLSPHEYRVKQETELNEMRETAGLPTKNAHGEKDSLLKDFLSKAGL